MTFSNIKKKWALGVVADLLRENALGEPVRPVEETRLELLAILNEIAGELPGKTGHPTENHYRWAMRVEARRRCLKKMGNRRPKGQAIEDVARLLKKSPRTVEKRIERTGKSRAAIYVLFNKGKFPTPVKLGPKSVAFVESEIDEWIEARLASRVKESHKHSIRGGN